jgi:hypothetical protein
LHRALFDAAEKPAAAAKTSSSLKLDVETEAGRQRSSCNGADRYCRADGVAG